MENERDEQKNVLHDLSDERFAIEDCFERGFRHDTNVQQVIALPGLTS